MPKMPVTDAISSNHSTVSTQINYSGSIDGLLPYNSTENRTTAICPSNGPHLVKNECLNLDLILESMSGAIGLGFGGRQLFFLECNNQFFASSYIRNQMYLLYIWSRLYTLQYGSGLQDSTLTCMSDFLQHVLVESLSL